MNNSTAGYLNTSIESTQSALCDPFMVPLYSFDTTNRNLGIVESSKLRDLLKTTAWIDKDISTIASNTGKEFLVKENTALGNAFFLKYGQINLEDDARSAVIDWPSELKRALSHINPRALRGKLLHIGSDVHFEPPVLHEHANAIILADISSKLLHRAKQSTRTAECIVTPIEQLSGIPDKSIDFYAALRVICSFHINPKAVIEQAGRVLRPGGAILFSISNGYRAVDDTILPGQIKGVPPELNLFTPFAHAIKLIGLLNSTGFRELYFVPGSSELFLGGTYMPECKAEGLYPILHTESADPVPLCFYSVHMPTAWLGNYSRHPVIINSETWPTAEHYFQAEKFTEHHHRHSILHCNSPAKAKCYAWSKSHEVRPDWNEVRVNVMRQALSSKFNQHPNLRKALLNTNKRELVERTSLDLFWGRSMNGEGRNVMGALLMELRGHYKTPIK